jgi:hypothetical protein
LCTPSPLSPPLCAELRFSRLLRAVVGALRAGLADDPLLGALVGPADEREHGAAEEPRVERTVEELELVVLRHERLTQDEVDVVLPCDVDRGEPAQRVRDTPRPDLDPDLAQHAPEGDDVAQDRGALQQPEIKPWQPCGPPRRGRRASRRGRSRCPRGT